jgi:hypothetical protein
MTRYALSLSKAKNGVVRYFSVGIKQNPLRERVLKWCPKQESNRKSNNSTIHRRSVTCYHPRRRYNLRLTVLAQGEPNPQPVCRANEGKKSSCGLQLLSKICPRFTYNLSINVIEEEEL